MRFTSLIAEGITAEELIACEDLLEPADKGEVRITLSEEPGEEQVAQLEQLLIDNGVVLTDPVTMSDHVLHVKFIEGELTISMIAAVVWLGSIIIELTVVSWQLFKVTLEIPWYLLAAAAAGSGVLVYTFAKR